MKSEEWQTYILSEYPLSMHLLHCPNGLPSHKMSPAQKHVHSPIHLIHLSVYRSIPAARVLSRTCINYPLSQVHHGAGGCAPTPRGVSVQQVQGYLRSVEHEYQARRAGFPTGGYADGFTLFGPSQYDLYWNFVV